MSDGQFPLLHPSSRDRGSGNNPALKTKRAQPAAGQLRLAPLCSRILGRQEPLPCERFRQRRSLRFGKERQHQYRHEEHRRHCYARLPHWWFRRAGKTGLERGLWRAGKKRRDPNQSCGERSSLTVSTCRRFNRRKTGPHRHQHVVTPVTAGPWSLGRTAG